MWQDRLRRIIEILESSSVNEIEVSFWGRRFRISKGNPSTGNTVSNPATVTLPGESVPLPDTSETVSAVAEEVEAAKGFEIRAPMVGTFYRAPSPEAAPFVEVGSHVSAGQTLCIIEAMKIMNEIESEITGRVAKILGGNAQPVEYGQRLFIIEPD